MIEQIKELIVIQWISFIMILTYLFVCLFIIYLINKPNKVAVPDF